MSEVVGRKYISKLLEGRVTVVTGSGNGIGRAEAMGMAAQSDGWTTEELAEEMPRTLTKELTRELPPTAL